MFASRMAMLLFVQAEEEIDCVAITSESARDDRCKLKYGRLHLCIGKNVSSVRVTEHWQKLLGEIVQ